MDGNGNETGATPAIQATIELCHKSVEAMAQLTRQNLEGMLAAAQGATRRMQIAVDDVTTFTQASLERSATAAQAISAVSSPTELLHIQTEFARAQFDATRVEMARIVGALAQAAKPPASAAGSEAKRPPVGKRAANQD